MVCRATLFNEEARFSENIDFQYPMKQACMREIDRFCKDVPHGQARVIRCLQVGCSTYSPNTQPCGQSVILVRHKTPRLASAAMQRACLLC